MKRKTFLAVLILLISLAMWSCGGGGSGSSSTTVVTQILTDSVFDGYIVSSLPTATFVQQGMTPGVQSVFAGIDPVSKAEYRAFLDFPLTGAGGVPGNAIIVSAVLDIVIDSIVPQPLLNTIPLRIDLVSFQPTLIATDFDRSIQPALISATISPPISQADFGNHVSVDVTALMQEAQLLGLADFQVRILEDGAVSPGLIEINDTTGADRGALAPLLEVTYQ